MGPQGAGTEAWEAPTPALGGGCSDPTQWRCRAQEQRVAGHRCPVPSPVCPSSPLLPPLAASGGKLGRGEWAEGSFIHSATYSFKMLGELPAARAKGLPG